MNGGNSSVLKSSGVGSDRWARELLRELLDAAIASADPALLLPGHLPPPPSGRCVIVGAGKAAASMAAAVERAWPEVDISGCVAVPYGYGMELKKVRVFEAGHPVPDENSITAARAALAAVGDLGSNDLVLALISGGGSATLCLPAEGMALADKQITNRLLLASGLDIRTMNAVRQRISAIKGGKLAQAAAPARVMTFAISDIPGDEAEAIASGPTATFSQKCDFDEIVAKLGPQLPESARNKLILTKQSTDTGNADPICLIATAADALKSAANLAKEKGITPIILGDAIEGEARDVARQMAQTAIEQSRPCVLLSGGETTVTVGSGEAGRGGRNTEFLLALIETLAGQPGIWALAADTDGEDGSNLGAAGAIAGPTTIARARDAGLNAAQLLADHDSGSFFAELDDLIMTGPTFTNVNDFRAILIIPQQDS